jgi:hypothetical protein
MKISRERNQDNTGNVVTIQLTEQDYMAFTIFPWTSTMATNRVSATPPTPYDAAMDTMESFLLALVLEGVDITTKPFYNAIASAFDAITNNLGDE